MKHLLALLALCAPALGQQGEVVIPSSYYIARNISDLIPPPADGTMVGVELGVNLHWDLAFEWEIAAVQDDPLGLISGHFESTLTYQSYWTLGVGRPVNPHEVLLTGSRSRPVTLRLASTYYNPVPWDGIVSYSGPTWQRVERVVPTQPRTVAIPLSVLDSGRDLWLETFWAQGSIVGYQSNGWKHHRTLNPWTATVTYRYF